MYFYSKCPHECDFHLIFFSDEEPEEPEADRHFYQQQPPHNQLQPQQQEAPHIPAVVNGNNPNVAQAAEELQRLSDLLRSPEIQHLISMFLGVLPFLLIFLIKSIMEHAGGKITKL